MLFSSKTVAIVCPLHGDALIDEGFLLKYFSVTGSGSLSLLLGCEFVPAGP